nr:MAG TPA: hypothetical protein [Caudoviricetes sp.]
MPFNSLYHKDIGLFNTRSCHFQICEWCSWSNNRG